MHLHLNAILGAPYSVTADGLETTVGVNHFGHYLLTLLLLPLLQRSQPSRIVVVGSALHARGLIEPFLWRPSGSGAASAQGNPIPSAAAGDSGPSATSAPPDTPAPQNSDPSIAPGAPSNLKDQEQRSSAPPSHPTLATLLPPEFYDPLHYSRMGAYPNSKLANLLFTHELSRRLQRAADMQRVTVNCVHPGVVATELGRGLPAWMRPLSAITKRIFFLAHPPLPALLDEYG